MKNGKIIIGPCCGVLHYLTLAAFVITLLLVLSGALGAACAPSQRWDVQLSSCSEFHGLVFVPNELDGICKIGSTAEMNLTFSNTGDEHLNVELSSNSDEITFSTSKFLLKPSEIREIDIVATCGLEEKKTNHEITVFVGELYYGTVFAHVTAQRQPILDVFAGLPTMRALYELLHHGVVDGLEIIHLCIILFTSLALLEWKSGNRAGAYFLFLLLFATLLAGGVI